MLSGRVRIKRKDGEFVLRGGDVYYLEPKSEEKKIRQVNSTFVLREWQAKGAVSSDGVISNSAPTTES